MSQASFKTRNSIESAGTPTSSKLPVDRTQRSEIGCADSSQNIKGEFTPIDFAESNNNNIEIVTNKSGQNPKVYGTGRSDLVSLLSNDQPHPQRKLIDPRDCIRIRVNDRASPPATKLTSSPSPAHKGSLGRVTSVPESNSILSPVDPFAMDALRLGNNDTTTSDRNHSSAGKEKKLSRGDQKNQSSSSSSPSNATTATPISLSLNTVGSTPPVLHHSKGSAQLHHQDSIPSYSSIFMQQQKHLPQEQPQEQPPAGAGLRREPTPARGHGDAMAAGRSRPPVRGPLKKQFAQTDIDEAVGTAKKLGSGRTAERKLSPRNFIVKGLSKGGFDLEDDNDSDEGDESAGDESDELSPFSHEGKNKDDSRTDKDNRFSPGSMHKDSSFVAYPHQLKHYRANLNNNRYPGTVPISHDNDINYQSAYNSCQPDHCHIDIPTSNRKLDWRMSALGCSKCNCNTCRKKRKLIMADNQSYHHHTSHSPLTYKNHPMSKTKTMHLVLKSIILILLTLLLLMLVVGAIMAGHFMPKLLERLTEAKTFNVTIAG